jgi:nucleoside-diphosphate-sugar epimerase
MKVLVTGGGGYLGSVLIPKLLLRGHHVRVVDIGYFGLGHLRTLNPRVETIRADLRRMAAEPELRDRMLDGVDCVIHLAAISNDPSAELHPHMTEEVNFHATVQLAEAAKERGIRFLFSSSCSVYGDAEGALTEDGVVNPLTVYAVSKVRSEQSLVAMTDASWRPVILRNGTLFGYSPRMRFDLVVNIFGLYSTLHNEVRIFGDGMQWRPFLSVQDCARAFVHFAEQRANEHLCYNIANENLRVVDVAAIFKTLNPGLKVTHVALDDPDRRDYRVSTARMRQAGFEPRIGVGAGSESIAEAIVCGLINDPESIFYRNAKWLKELTLAGTGDHGKLIDLMESFGSVQRPVGTTV